jgi:hypothetical protein
MKYSVQMGSGAMIYIPSVIKIGSGVQKEMDMACCSPVQCTVYCTVK